MPDRSISFPFRYSNFVTHYYYVYTHRMKKIRKGWPNEQLDRVVNLDF